MFGQRVAFENKRNFRKSNKLLQYEMTPMASDKIENVSFSRVEYSYFIVQ